MANEGGALFWVLIVSAVIFAAFGLIFAGLFLRARRWKQVVLPVIRNIEEVSSDGQKVWRPVFRIVDDDKAHVANADFRRRPKIEVGDEVALRYNPANPTKVSAASVGGYGVAALVFLIVAAVVGMLAFLI